VKNFRKFSQPVSTLHNLRKFAKIFSRLRIIFANIDTGEYRYIECTERR